MVELSVNVNKIATLRNARGGERPSVVAFAQAAIDAGAYGITVHPRPDERHIRARDVFDLVPVVRQAGVELNIEGYPDRRYVEIIREARPDQATLVPDPPDVLTSNAGWDAAGQRKFLGEIIAELQSFGARVSLFMETALEPLEAARDAGADRVELYTGPYAEACAAGRGDESYALYEAAARRATELGLGLNAGHDLDLENLPRFRHLPGLQEVSIGHALTCDALEMGWDRAVRSYLAVLAGEPLPKS
ncbi:MAG: pyridoxine 5'-phosphate synthase [Acidobacteriota bacterium]|nr:pyridoxine 5'-phosphate synthase [Acidobacteriota bacterium]